MSLRAQQGSALFCVLALLIPFTPSPGQETSAGGLQRLEVSVDGVARSRL